MTSDALDSQRASIDVPPAHGESSAAEHLEHGAPFFAVDREWRVPDIAVPHSPYVSELHRARRHPSTVVVVAPPRFLEGVLWPEYLALSGDLEAHLAGVADRVIRAVIHDDVSEAEERVEPNGLPAA